MKKLIPALVLLLVSAIVLSTSSYAWFSMNRTVQATGISLTAAAPTNLVISSTGSTYAASASTDENYLGKLFPASTADGKDFWAIDDGNVIAGGKGGPAEAGTIFKKEKVEIMVQGDDKATGYYVDFDFYFKATAADETPLNIGVKKITVNSGPDSDSLGNAVRIAIIPVDENGDPDYSQVTIYAFDDGEDVEPIESVDETGVFEKSDTDPRQKPVGEGDDKVYTTTAFTVTPSTDIEDATPTRVIIRVWIEGEHSDCVNANALDELAVQVDFYVIEEEE